MADNTYEKMIREGGRDKVWSHNELYLEEALKRGDDFGLGTEYHAPGFFADELIFFLRKGIDPGEFERYRVD